MAHTVVSSVQNPAALLRDRINQLESGTVKPSAASLEPLLLELDAAQATFAALEDQGVDLRAERVRWENLTRRLASRPQLIANAARAVPGGLPALRARHQRAPESAPWWGADLAHATRRRRLFFEIIAIVVGLPLALTAAYLSIERLFPPSPAAVAVVETEAEIDRAVAAGDVTTALPVAEAAFAANPQERTLAAWVAVLADVAGQKERSGEAALATEKLFDADKLNLWLTWSTQYARVGRGDAALSWARQAVESYPESAEAWFTLARAASMTDDRALAFEALERVSVLAEESDPELAVSARILYAEMLQRPPALATLEAGETITSTQINP